MTRTELEKQIELCRKRLETDGHSKDVMDTNRWITNCFVQYCDRKQYGEITFDVIKEFLMEQFAIDPLKQLCGTQMSIRRPLLILWEYSQTGNYLKSHLPEQTKVPETYRGLYIEFCSHVSTLALSITTKTAKARFAKQFLSYLEIKNITSISDMSKDDVSEYINSLLGMSNTTKQSIAYNLRKMLNWLNETGKIAFSGYDVFPQIRYPGRKFISSCYSGEEIRKMLSCVDTDTAVGKHDYLVLCLLSYYGLRVGDIIALRFSNIDWSLGLIQLTQQKTKKPLALPLIDEVKLPLLDYIKNARPDVNDPHVLITLCAPHTAYARNQTLQRIVVKYMDKAGIDYTNKHHGTHALRFSLAVGLLDEKVPISAISGVLGHGSIATTDLYLGNDYKNLSELSLEVPDVSDT